MRPRSLASFALLALLLAAALPLSASSPADDIGPAGEPMPWPSIAILGDEGFELPTSGVSGGSGTADDPYVIRDLVIVRSAPWGLLLQDTRAHVVIENVVIESHAADEPFYFACPPLLWDTTPCETRGFSFERAENITVRDVRVERTTVGLEMREVKHVVVDGYVATPIAGDLYLLFTGAVRVYDSEDVVLRGLDLPAAKDPLYLHGVQGGVLESSSFAARPNYGFAHVSLVDIHDFVIRGNVFENVHLYRDGPLEKRLQAVRVEHNAFSGPYGGIDLGYAVDSLVCGNVVEGGEAVYGLQVIGDRSVVVGNRVSGAGVVVDIHGQDMRVEDNTFRDGGYLSGHISGSGILRNNAFENNADVLRMGGPLDAGGNWWGSADGPNANEPGAQRVEADSGVVLAPWLTEAPALEPYCPS